MFPATSLRETNEPISYQAHGFGIKNERFARIAKWKTDAAAAGEQTAHFHQRNQRRQSTPTGKLKIERLMVISLVKHLCPGTGVETTGIAMQSDNMRPNPDGGQDRESAFAAISCSSSAPPKNSRQRRTLLPWVVIWLVGEFSKGFSLDERTLTNRFADAASDILDLFCG